MYDTIPGGTGYLAKLYNTQEFSKLLQDAYDNIKECKCQLEGKDGCYHCILTYGNQYSRDAFSREQAEAMFGKLVDGANTWERIDGSVGTIAQAGAAEDSELELKFIRAMQTMAKNNNWEFEKVPDDDSYHYELHLIDDRDNTELHYSIRPQFELTMAYGVRHITIPDFQIMCTYAKIGGIEIEDLMKIPWWSVYLDGYKYHACDPNMRFYSDLEKREGIKQAKPQRMFSWIITWEDVQLFESEKEDELGLNSVSRLGQLLEKAQLGAIKEDCFWCINDVPNFFPNGAAFYEGSIQLYNNCDENLTDTSSDDEVDQAFSNVVKYEIHLHKGLRELDKDEWVSFWRRYNLIQFWSAGSKEETDGTATEAVFNREEIKELYPGMEDIVDILLDNNVPFSHEGIFELTNVDNEVIASAAMIIDNPKIAINPFDSNDSSVFEQNGYMVIAQEDFNEELIK